MIQPLRKTHRGIFLVLALLLPALFLSGIVFRHSWPAAKPEQAKGAQASPTRAGAGP
jgi:hypothetical protein